MKKDKFEKWLSGRNELIIREDVTGKLIPYLSKKSIDRQTSSDLLIIEYFHLIDRAVTTPGRNVLYALLRSPLSDEKEMGTRRNFMSAISANEKIIPAARNILWKIRFSPVYSVNSVLFENASSLFTREKLAMLLLVFVFTVIAVPLLFSHLAFYSVLSFLVISFLIFARNLSIYNNYIPGLINLAAHYNAAQKIIKMFKSKGIEDPHISRLADSLPAAGSILPSLKILQTGSFTSGDPLQLLLFWLKNIFCLDLLAFNRAVDIINSNRGAFINFYCCYGIIDAMIVLSEKIASEPEKFCKAEFHSERSLSAEKMYHPLLADPVSNSVSIERGIILTGSNMSGKSTFLRTLGLNAVLAQTTGYCHAGRFRLPFVNIISIINKQDDMNSGESFYFFEAKRISGMINLKDGGRYLFLIDELLSGTNSLERVSASISIIRYLINMKHIIFTAATHDVSIAKHLESECGCYYFSDVIENEEMRFDYRLKPGIIKTTNAIRMLEILGLPDQIIKNAQKLISHQECEPDMPMPTINEAHQES